MRLQVEREARIIHPGDRRSRGGLELIGACLRPEILEQRRTETPEPEDIARGVSELLFAQLLARPVGRLQLLRQLDLAIVFDRRREAALGSAERQSRRLLGIVDLPRVTPSMIQEGEIEGRVMNDRRDALRAALRASTAGLTDVDDRDAWPAAIDLGKPDFGPVRIEASGLGVVYFGVQDLELGFSLGGDGVDLSLGGLLLLRRLPIGDRLVVDGLPFRLRAPRAARARMRCGAVSRSSATGLPAASWIISRMHASASA